MSFVAVGLLLFLGHAIVQQLHDGLGVGTEVRFVLQQCRGLSITFPAWQTLRCTHL